MFTRQAPAGKWGVATYALQKTGEAQVHRDHRGHRVTDAPYAPYADGGDSGNDVCDGAAALAPEFWEAEI